MGVHWNMEELDTHWTSTQTHSTYGTLDPSHTPVLTQQLLLHLPPILRWQPDTLLPRSPPTSPKVHQHYVWPHSQPMLTSSWGKAHHHHHHKNIGRNDVTCVQTLVYSGCVMNNKSLFWFVSGVHCCLASCWFAELFWLSSATKLHFSVFVRTET